MQSNVMEDKVNTPVVYIVDDDKVVCDALFWLLSDLNLKPIVYHDSLTFLEDFQPHATGCIILDIRMPGISGLDLQDELQKRNNKLPIIFLTGHGDISMAVRAMKAGAFDFITKPFNNQVLLEQIQRAIRQQSHPQTTGPSPELNNYLAQLTQREKEILVQLVEGKMNKQIAHQFNIAQSTVELHRAKLMQKLGANNLAELIKIYYGLL